jgi:hypothetical protein
MTEDQAFEIAMNSHQVKSAIRAMAEAQRFIEQRSAAELGIMTLRKAFEEGYRLGASNGKLQTTRSA